MQTHIDAYYRFAKHPESKARTRRSYVEYSFTYPVLHRSNSRGDVLVYISDTNNIDALPERKASKRLSNAEHHVTSIFHPSTEHPHLAYGDYRGDLLLFRFSQDEAGEPTLDVFVCKGRKNEVWHLFDRFTEGELDDEIAWHRAEGRGPRRPGDRQAGRLERQTPAG